MAGPYDVTPYNSLPSPWVTPSPLFPARPWEQYNAFGSVDFGNPLLNAAVMLGSPILANRVGGTPLSIGALPGGNLHNNIRMQMFSRNHMAAMRQAAVADTSALMDTFRGFSSEMGVDTSTPEYNTALGNFGSFFAQNVGPMAPGFMDRMSGGRSAVALTHGLHLAGRNQYDPFTGRLGMSADSASTAGMSLWKSMKFDTPNDWRGQTNGFTAGQMGEIYGEMSSRGMLSPMTSVGNYGIDTNRMKQQLQEMTKPLAAIKEIFGDAGHPNAPMRELWAALESITQGAVYQIDPARTNVAIRNLREAANYSGAGMQGAYYMMQAAGAQAQSLGLVQGPWAMQSVTDALNFKVGLESSGAMSVPGWGRGTPEQLMAMRQQLDVRNAASPVMNTLGALKRLKDVHGVNNASVNGWLADAERGIMSGDLAGMEENEVMEKIASQTGMSLSKLEQIFEQRTANEEHAYAGGPGFAQAAIAASRQELVDLIMGAEGGTIHDITHGDISGAVGNTAGAAELTRALSGSAGAAFKNMNSKVSANTATRRNDVAAHLEVTLREQAASGNAAAQKYLAQLTATGDVGGALAQLADRMYGGAEQASINSGLLNPGDRLTNLLAATAPDVQAATADAAARASMSASMGSLAAGKFDPDMIRRAMTALQEAGTDPSKANVTSLALKTLGIADNSEMAERMSEMIGGAYDAEAKYREERTKIEGEKFTYNSLDKRTADEQLKDWTKSRDSRIEALDAERGGVDNVLKMWKEFTSDPANAEIVEKLKQMAPDIPIDGEKASGGANDLSFTIQNLNLNGELVAKNVKGEVTPHGSRSDVSGPAVGGGGIS